MFKKFKKGFTIVELVIVIAVIAILAGVLIPVFSNMVKKANESADLQLIRNLNTRLYVAKVTDGKNETMYDALKDAEEAGYKVSRINAQQTQNEILWDQENDWFVYLRVENGNETVEYLPELNVGTPLSAGDYRLWKISNTIDETYATYYTGNLTNITTSKPFDAGESANIKSIDYVNEGSAQTKVVIRTNDFSTTLSIDALFDTVYHYGNTSLVDVININNASYHYFNTLGRLKVENGHAVAEPGSVVITPMDMDGEELAASIEIKEGAKVYTEGDYVKLDSGVADGHVEDCGAGHHDFGEKIVVDNHVYELCKCCGYTMITIQDQLGNETKQSKNIITVDEEGNKTVTENVTPILTYETETIISSTAVAEGTNYTIATETNEKGEEVEKVLTEEIEVSKLVKEDEGEEPCEHEFVGKVIVEPKCTQTGIKAFVCKHCGTSYNVTLAKTAHRFYDDEKYIPGYEFDHTEKCIVCGELRQDEGKNTVVAMIGNEMYDTLEHALAADLQYRMDNSKDSTYITKIVLTNNDAIKGNGGWKIDAKQNIVLDLNGYSLKNLVTENKESKVISNFGFLTVMDSTDINKDGTGLGTIYNELSNEATFAEWPTTNYGTYVINNEGTFVLQSGKILTTQYGSMNYAFENHSNTHSAYFTMNGGCIENTEERAIRMFINSSNLENKIVINGGVVKGAQRAIWAQFPSSTSKTPKMASVEVNGGSIIANGDAFCDTTQGEDSTGMRWIISGGIIKGNIATVHSDVSLVITGGIFDFNVYGFKTYGAFNDDGKFEAKWQDYSAYRITPNVWDSIESCEADGFKVFAQGQYFEKYGWYEIHCFQGNPSNLIATEGYKIVSLGDNVFKVEKIN